MEGSMGERMQAIWRALERVGVRSRDDKGVALVEFALVLPLLLLLVIGMMDFGKAINYWIDESHLAAEGARFAAVDKNPGPEATLQLSLQQQADTAELRDANVCIAFPNGAVVGEPVEVTVRYSYSWLPFIAGELGLDDISIVGKAK